MEIPQDLEPKVLAQALALKKGDVSTFERLEDEDEDGINEILDSILLVDEPAGDEKSPVREDDSV